MSIWKLTFFIFAGIALIIITLSQSVQAWEGAVTIDEFVMHESSTAQGDNIPVTVTITNHDVESHSIHFRGLLVDSNGEYVRGDDGAAILVHVYLPGQLYQIWPDETKTLEIGVQTYNLPLGTWTADIGVLLYDDDDEVTDMITTSQFEITAAPSSLVGGTDFDPACGAMFACFILFGVIMVFVVKGKQQKSTMNETPGVMLVQPPPPAPAAVALPPPTKIMHQQTAVQQSIPIPYTSLPAGGQYEQVGNVNIYTTLDGRKWIQQPDGNFVQN